MRAVLLYDDGKQDASLTMRFLAEMQRAKWVFNENFPKVFTKTFRRSMSGADVQVATQNEIDKAVRNATWKQLPYVLVMTNEGVVSGISV